MFSLRTDGCPRLKFSDLTYKSKYMLVSQPSDVQESGRQDSTQLSLDLSEQRGTAGHCSLAYRTNHIHNALAHSQKQPSLRLASMLQASAAISWLTFRALGAHQGALRIDCLQVHTGILFNSFDTQWCPLVAGFVPQWTCSSPSNIWDTLPLRKYSMFI